MSAIWALLHLDGAPVEPDHLEGMGQALASLGPDGANLWREGPVGLGHGLMVFTPEDRFEQQPLVSSDGQLVLVVDGRLDNRPELADALQLEPAAARRWPDSAFVLRAFETWGEDCPQRLIGGLAWMVWHRQRRRLFAAISPSHSCALFYHQTQRTLALASLPPGLLALPWVPRRVNQDRLTGFLGGSRGEDREEGRTATFFEGIHRLPAGHTLTAEGSALDIRSFWAPDLTHELRLPRDDDYVEAFSALFGRVVSDHLRSATPVSVMMSGGQDSTAVAALAAPMLKNRGDSLLTFTSIPDARAADPLPSGRFANETDCVLAVAAMYDNLTPEFISTDGSFFLDDLEAHFDHNYAPPRALTNRLWLDAILRATRERGRRVILTGEAGNRVISWAGHSVISYYLRQGRYGDAWREARALSQRGRPYPPWRAFLVHGLVPLLPETLRPRLDWLRSLPNKHINSPLRPAYAAAHGLELRRKRPASRLGRNPGGNRQSRFGTDYHVPGWRSQFGVDARDPTGDQRLVAFCLSVPHDQFQRNGQPRWLLRRAMAGRLPPEVLDSKLRGLQGSDWVFRFRNRRDDALATLARLRANEMARDMLDLDRLGRLLESLPDPESGAETVDEYRVVQDGLAAGCFILWAQAGA